MTFRRGGNRSSFRRGTRRASDWQIAVESSAFVNVPANSSVLLISITAAALSAIGPFTIVRSRGYLSVVTDQFAAEEDQIGGVGMALVNDRARAVGISALPVPTGTELLDDRFFWIQMFGQRFLFGSAIGMEPKAAESFVIDSKAMRKVKTDDALVITASNPHATNGFNLAIGMRILTKAG